MMTDRKEKTPGWQAEGFGSGNAASKQQFHVHSATADPLLQRLEGANGRYKCPSCGGRSRKVCVTESNGKVLIYCFGGCKAIEVLEAVGLTWADVMPPRHWPESPEERRRARRAMQQASFASAVEVFALEGKVILYAARELHMTGGLEIEDGKRLAVAVSRVEGLADMFVEARR